MTNDEVFSEGSRMIYNALNEGVNISLSDIDDMILRAKKGAVKPAKQSWQNYQALATGASLDALRCDMLIAKLQATKKLLQAQEEYFDSLSAIEHDNALGFDLSL